MLDCNSKLEEGHVSENYKTISYDENGDRLLVYDPYKDEIFNIQTGEVIQ